MLFYFVWKMFDLVVRVFYEYNLHNILDAIEERMRDRKRLPQRKLFPSKTNMRFFGCIRFHLSLLCSLKCIIRTELRIKNV